MKVGFIISLIITDFFFTLLLLHTHTQLHFNNQLVWMRVIISPRETIGNSISLLKLNEFLCFLFVFITNTNTPTHLSQTPQNTFPNNTQTKRDNNQNISLFVVYVWEWDTKNYGITSYNKTFKRNKERIEKREKRKAREYSSLLLLLLFLISLCSFEWK